MRWMYLLLGAALLFLGYSLDYQPALSTPASPAVAPKALVPGEPVQTDLAPGQMPEWSLNNYQIVPLARYEITARLLHRQSYSSGREAELSPVDFALGWNRMADPAVDEKENISQGDRWYRWHWYGSPPIPDDEVIRSSANTHLIPGNGDVERHLAGMDAGDIVKLSGYLVEIRAPDGWRWSSSLSRNDTGEHSCELMWVNDAVKVGR